MSSQSKERFPSITVVSHRFADDGPMKPGAKIECSQCDGTHVIRLTGPFNAYHAAERFKKAGWEVVPRKTRCPSCVKVNRHPRRETGDTKLGAQLRLVHASPIDRASPLAIAAATGRVELFPSPAPRAEPVKESLMPQQPEPERTTLTSTSAPRVLTVEDRAAVRQALADGQRVFDKWQKDMNERLDASTSALKSAADEMRGELVKIQNRINQQAQARGLRI